MTANGNGGKGKNIKNSIFVILFMALAAAFLSPLASSSPDGLDWTIERHAAPPAVHSQRPAETAARPEFSGENGGYFIFGDYKAPFIKSESVSTVVSGVAGIALILLFFKFYGRAAVKSRREGPPAPGAPRA